MENFIFKTSTSNIYHFYFIKPSSFKFRKLLRNNTWTTSTSIISDTTPSLYMECDKDDNFHIIYQNIQGSIIYSYFDGENTKSYEMLKSRTNEVYDRHFKILPLPSATHFFYVLQKDNTGSLIHQVLNKNGLSMPKILITLPCKEIQYCIDIDMNQDIHSFYLPKNDFTTDKIIQQTGYKIFSNTKNLWSDNLIKKVPPIMPSQVVNPTPFQIQYDPPTTHISCKYLTSTGVVLLSQVVENNVYSLVLKIFNQYNESTEYKLLQQEKPFRYPELVVHPERLLLCFQDNKFMYIQELERFKLSQEKRIKFPLLGSELSNYASKHPYDTVSVSNTPAFLTKGLYIPLISKIDFETSYTTRMQNELLILKRKIAYLEGKMDKK